MKTLIKILIVLLSVVAFSCEKPPLEEPTRTELPPPPTDTTGANPIGG